MSSPTKNFKRSFKVKETRFAEMIMAAYAISWGAYFSITNTKAAIVVIQLVETINTYGGKYLWCSTFVVVGVAQFLGVHYHYPQWRNWAARVGMALWSTTGAVVFFADSRIILMWLMCIINALVCFVIQLHRTAELSV